MTKEEKENKIASALMTKEGQDKLGMAIVEGLFNMTNKPGSYQILAQAVIDSYSKNKHTVRCPSG